MGLELLAILGRCGGASRPFDAWKSLRIPIFAQNCRANQLLCNFVTNIQQTCPQCKEQIFAEKGRVSECLICGALQVHGEPNFGEKWRKCPNCDVFFQVVPHQIVSCPNCQTNQVHPEKYGIVQ